MIIVIKGFWVRFEGLNWWIKIMKNFGLKGSKAYQRMDLLWCCEKEEKKGFCDCSRAV